MIRELVVTIRDPEPQIRRFFTFLLQTWDENFTFKKKLYINRKGFICVPSLIRTLLQVEIDH